MPRAKLSFESIPDDDELRDDPSKAKQGIVRSLSARTLGLRRKRKDEVVVVDSPSNHKEDPVMAHLRSRATQKVRFSIADATPAAPAAPTAPVIEKTPSSLKRFMSGALFGGSFRLFYQDEMQKEMKSLGWDQGAVLSSPDRINSSCSSNEDVTPLDKAVAARVNKLMNKARRAMHVHHQYQYAVKCHVKALDLLKPYPDDHPIVINTIESMSHAQQLLSTYQNSAKIVKMGIKSEEDGELVRALKMYTIAYRMRRDNLPNHPGLVSLLNLLGSIQSKRGDLDEAMQTYELALSDLQLDGNDELPPPIYQVMRSVTLREMGSIHEQWGADEKALKLYHQSLSCIAEHKGIIFTNPVLSKEARPQAGIKTAVDVLALDEEEDISTSTDEARVETKSTQSDERSEVELPTVIGDSEASKASRGFVKKTEVVSADNVDDAGAMEIMLGLQRSHGKSKEVHGSSLYDVFFPPSLEGKLKVRSENDDNSDVDIAVTISYIGQLHRNRGEFNVALATFGVALRGMRYVLGKYHPNVAAILGKIGNMKKEMGDMDRAFETYQQVLAIETYRLGLNHPDVSITLHNIATIDAARGNLRHALSLYEQVLSLQCQVFGEDSEALAVTSACMGDVYERMGDDDRATDCFEEALRIKMMIMGRNSLQVARLFHKLGKLSICREEFKMADICLTKALASYRLNSLSNNDAWVVEAKRDAADIDAAIALGRGDTRRAEV